MLSDLTASLRPATISSQNRRLARYPKEVLLEAEIRLVSKTVRIGTKGLKKGLDFPLNFPLPRSVRQAYQNWALLSAFHFPYPENHR